MCKYRQPAPSLPSPVSSHLCAKQVFPKTNWCQDRAPPPTGGAPTCRHRMHTQQKVRCQADCLYDNNYTHTRKFHKSIINCTLQKLHPLSKSSASELQILSATMRTLRPSGEEEIEKRRGKNRPGECPTQSLLSSLLTFKRVEIETAVSRMTWNILCQRLHQREGLKAKPNSWSVYIHRPNSKLSPFLCASVQKKKKKKLCL